MTRAMTFREVYDSHVRFVWRAMARLGVPGSDLADAVQDVFLVVHRRLPEFEARSKMTTWLFGIASRVAADRRRVAHTRKEFLVGEVPGHAGEGGVDSTALVDERRARAILDGILDRMPDEQRTVFMLFELEGMTGDEIADLLDVPVGTVRSRLRLAREAFHDAVARMRTRERAQEGALPVAREAWR